MGEVVDVFARGMRRRVWVAGPSVVGLVLALGLPACRTPAPGPAGPQGPAAVPAAPREAGIALRVDTERSLLTILVHRGGPLARLGHNHVIAVRSLAGVVRLARERESSTFELRLAVAQFTVDEEALRALEGPDFAAPVPDDARSGTRRNMLSEALLDGEHYPDIVLRSQRIARTPEGFQVTIAIGLKGLARSISLPVHIEESDGGLIATGETPLLQSALGLEPFSVMLGALRVEDELRVRFRVLARPAAADTGRG